MKKIRKIALALGLTVWVGLVTGAFAAKEAPKPATPSPKGLGPGCAVHLNAC